MMFIQVPCNLELKAGVEVIRCEIEFPGEKKEEKGCKSTTKWKLFNTSFMP